MVVAAILALQITSSATTAACRADEEAALARSAALVEHGGDPLAREPLFQSTADACAAVALARLSLVAWDEARALANIAGDPAQLGPINARLDEFRRFASGSLAVDAEYALVSVRAAVAAAQDERPEVDLLLTHARDLSERLAQRQRPARWPRPFNLLAGELWLEVDRFDDARQAFERAVRADQSRALAQVGLAEALLRLDRREEACRTIREVRDAAGPLDARVRRLTAACP